MARGAPRPRDVADRRVAPCARVGSHRALHARVPHTAAGGTTAAGGAYEGLDGSVELFAAGVRDAAPLIGRLAGWWPVGLSNPYLSLIISPC